MTRTSIRPCRSWAYVACLFAFACAGCSKTTDVTNNPNHGNFSAVVGAWKSKTELRLIRIRSGLFLTARSDLYNWEELVATLPAGTEIKVDRLLLESTVETDLYHAMGSLASGPNAGKQFEISMNLFSKAGDTINVGTYKQRLQKWAIDVNRFEKAGPVASAHAP